MPVRNHREINWVAFRQIISDPKKNFGPDLPTNMAGCQGDKWMSHDYGIDHG